MYGWYSDNSVFLEDPGVYLNPRGPIFKSSSLSSSLSLKSLTTTLGVSNISSGGILRVPDVVIKSAFTVHVEALLLTVCCHCVRATPGELVPDNKVTVKGLTEGKPYEFRVAAVNEAGPGQYAETKEPIKPAPPPSWFLLFLLTLHK